MTEPTNHWKLGLFVVAGALLALTAIIYFSTQGLRKQTVPYTSFFDEAVTGLEVGSPVKFRGVTIGNVSDIEVASDRRHVEIHYELGVSTLSRLGLAAGRGERTKISVPPDLRVQLGSTGVTGVKYILIDFCEVKNCPIEPLPFAVPENYIPSQPSSLKNIEDSVVHAVDDFPRISQQMLQTLSLLQTVLHHVDDARLPEKVATTLTDADQTFLLLRTTLTDVHAKQLSESTLATLGNLNSTLRETQVALARVDGDRGLLASVQRMSDNIGDLAGNARTVGPDVTDTLREVHDAAASVRQFLDALELDSDMLLKGRARSSK